MARRNGGLGALGALVLVLYVAGVALAGDPDVANLLYEKGEDAFRARDDKKAEHCRRDDLNRADFYQMPGGVDRSAWNRYRIRVQGTRVAFLFNGKAVFHYDAPFTGLLYGMPGFTGQDRTSEFKSIRVVEHGHGR